MTFNDNKSIYEQVTDYCYAHVISGEWSEGERIPSTKDLAVQMGVNPRTVMKAYDRLAEEEVIFQRRGMGYYISEDARKKVLEARRRAFREVFVPTLAQELRELGISAEQLMHMLSDNNCF